MAGWALKLLGYVTGNGAEVTANNRLKVDLETDVAANPAQVGGVRLFCENDAGAITGAPYLKSGEITPDYRLRVGADTELFTDTFNALTQNTSLWSYTFATLTAAQPGAGTVNFSAVQGTTNAHGAFMSTHQLFALSNTGPLAIDIFAGQFNTTLVANEVWLMGLGQPTAAVTRPTDGVWLRLTTAGLEGIIAYNGVEYTTTFPVAVPLATFTVGSIYKFTIVIGEHEIEYWLDDQLLGEQDIPPANGLPWLATAAPVFLQKYNTGAVANTNTMRVCRVGVNCMDLSLGKPVGHLRAAMGLMSYQGQNGHTMGTSALLPNATAATTVTGAALSQTVAIATGLGGQAGITAAVPGVDGLVTAFRNPAPTINITGRNLIITGIRIDSVNIGAAVATTASVLQWSLAFGATGATVPSLAQVESASFATATAKAWRRVPLGLQSWVVGAAIGSPAEAILITFDSPVVVHPGQWIAAVAKFIVGTATASQVIWANVHFSGYYD